MDGVTEGKVNGRGQEPQAIIPAATTAILPSNEHTVDQMLATADRQIAFRKGIVKLIAVNLDPSDVALYGEGEKQTIHLTKHACKQILSWAGITVQPDSGILEKRYDGVEGPYIDFEVWATWIRGTQAYRTMGNRSTYDDFFAKRTKYACEYCGADIEWRRVGNEDKSSSFCKAGCRGENRTRWTKTEYYLPLSEVDIPSIKQAAITNLWNHVVEDAGLKPSKRELEAVGFNFEQAGANVKFNTDKAPQSTGQKPQVASPSKAAAATTPTTPKPAAAAPPKAEVPKAAIPKDANAPTKPAQNTSLPVGKGIVSEVVEKRTKPNKTTGKGGGKPFLEIIQNGHFLYCFANHEIETMEGPEKTFALIQDAKGQFCEFTIETKDGERPMHSIVGATRIGRHEWDTDGTPIRKSDGNGYQASDEDIPF